MTTAEMIRAMFAAGTLTEAIALAVEVVEAKNAEIAALKAPQPKDAKELRRERNARYRDKMRRFETVRDDVRRDETLRDADETARSAKPLILQEAEAADETLGETLRQNRLSPSPPPEVSPLLPFPHTPLLTTPLPTPHHIPIPNTQTGRAREFDQFWEAYPAKIGKQAARKKFDQARDSGVSLDRLLTAIADYKRMKPPDRDYCHPATWLNQGRWDDEHTTQFDRDAARQQPARRPTGSSQMLAAFAEIARGGDAGERGRPLDPFAPADDGRTIELAAYRRGN